jgi:predicted helicase
MQRGVFYTPRPVVSYIVRSADELLRAEFGLEDGLADITTWAEMIKRHKHLQIPEGVSASQDFVQILDPATGTGTFLVEVLDLIYKTLVAKWMKQGYSGEKIEALWNEYVPRHLLPRLHGYELLMAPYAIAHLKIGLKLYETGYRFGSDERARIYLTNALEPAHDFSGRFTFAIPALAHEANAVNEIKRHQRFTVVIGNPPYSGISANRNDWIEGLLKGEHASQHAIANYYEVNGESLAEKKVWLQDDYVKFMRLSQFLLEQSSAGVLGMITNHSYVDSPTCRGMRFQMANFYSLLNFVDLHGSTKKGEEAPDDIADENVFDILPGVAIAICARIGSRGVGQVKSYDLWGSRNVKSEWLLQHALQDVKWVSLNASSPYYLFVKRNLNFDREYLAFFSLKEIFPFYGTGIQTSRDDFAIDFKRSTLEGRLRSFFDLSKTDKQVADQYDLSDTRGWKVKEVRRSSNFAKVRNTITQCLFRAFDSRWIALCKDIVDWPRLDVMSCVAPDRLGLLCSRQQSVPGFRHAFVVESPVDMFCISNKSREGQTLFPLFAKNSDGLFKSSEDTTLQANIGTTFAISFRKELSNNGNLHREALTDAEAIDIFYYIYAMLYSPAYRNRYDDLLKMDYPRLPLTGNLELFRALAGAGSELVALHLLKSRKVEEAYGLLGFGESGS